MLVIGAFLLLPGLCSLVFMIAVSSELTSGDPMVQMFAVLWIICFAISAVGIALIRAARKDARAAARKPASDGPSPP